MNLSSLGIAIYIWDHHHNGINDMRLHTAFYNLKWMSLFLALSFWYNQNIVFPFWNSLIFLLLVGDCSMKFYLKYHFTLFCFIYFVWLYFKQRWYFLCCREKELAAVKIKSDDVDIIANELEVSVYYFNPCSLTHVFGFQRLTIRVYFTIENS